ncbi:HAD-IA family hydrolase [Nocardioides sp. AX2bis]|uniref:HAD-IA family hydrolase n=1 Tax=Nocardioides sp. AX2bis TaxID=2653157 RepID=UPI0012F093A9|nr:HAD-IA family hydrolase [Nocardioides sp. AX2bis]VXC06662.1 Haloacid dehalogenase [Nocardioides sp. AX2bis]
MSRPVRHVLLDADGVLQRVPGDWVALVEPWLGPDARGFLEGFWSEEMPALRGEGDFLSLLEDHLRRAGNPADPREVFEAVWLAIEVDPTSMALVDELRATGVGVHLGTNQERHRAAHMRTVLGYDDLFDVSCYSCDLGAAKPEPAYFERAVERLRDEAAGVLFVDDRADNVEAARSVGLRAEQWHLDDGHDRLRAVLAAHGVLPTP